MCCRSEVTVVVLGQKRVGKTSFIEHCFVRAHAEEFSSDSADVVLQADVPQGVRLSRHAKVLICGREVSIHMVDSPGRQQLVPAIMVIVLFDVTQKVN